MYIYIYMPCSRKEGGYFCLGLSVSGQGIQHMSYEKKPPTFHSTGWLIGILLIMVYYNPYMLG